MKLFDKWEIKRISKKSFSGNYNLQNEEFVRAFLDSLKVGYKQEDYVGAVYNSIDTWGLYFAKAKFRLYESTPDKTKEIKEHEFTNILSKPNSYQTWWEMAYKIPAHWGLFGNSYLRIIRNKFNDEPIGLQMLLPSFVTRVSGKTPIDYYEYNDGNTRKKIASKDMIDLRYPHPQKDGDGHAIINSVFDQTEVNALQMHYMKKFFKEGGFMGLTFSTDKDMSPLSFEKAKKMLEDKYGGKEKAYQVGLFDNGLKPVTAAYSIKDMDIAESRKITKEDIYEGFKIPRILLGGGESVNNRATAEAAIYQFTSGVIDPVLNYVDEVFTNFVKDEYGNEFRVMHDTLAPKDQEASLKYFETAFKNGAITLNEWRDEEGYDKYEHQLADVPIVNVGGALVRIDTAKQIGAESEQRQKAKKEKGAANPTSKEGIVSENWKALDEDYKALRWKQFDRKVTSASRRFNREIEGYADAQRRRILEAVKDNFIVEDVFNLQEEDMILWQLLEIEVYSIFEAGYKHGAFLYDHSPTLFERGAFLLEFENIASNALQLNATTYDRLKGITADNYESFEKQINQVYEKDVTNRTTILTKTTSAGSFNAGLLKVMKDAGLTKKVWLTMRDSKVRNRVGGENHLMMDGVVVGIDEPFNVPSRNGYDLMMYPADPSGSPENVVNDRCTIIGEE